MVVKHDEAHQYWCPMARVTSENPGSMNRYFGGRDKDGHLGPGGIFCLGNQCMAWRQFDSKSGYCGLAGEPKI